MSPNRRIFLNIIATYGRSLYALVIGLFTARWVLMALGQEDFGLYGLIAGLSAFVAFFNNLLSSAIGRFYSVAIGAAQKNPEEGLNLCREWFSTAVVIHTVVPTVLVLIGYPIGLWAIRGYLVISPGRIDVCVWVWRFVCASCFVSMVNVPFNAMYIARQEIAELTIYGVASTTCSFIFILYMVNHPTDWLLGYAGGMCLITAAPQFLICMRALRIFPECKFLVAAAFQTRRIRELLSFASWQFIGMSGSLLKWQGISVLVNKYFGVRVNAAMDIGHRISSNCMSLASSIQGAFTPAIMNAYGAGLYKRAEYLAYGACKFGTLCILIFALPLILESEEVLHLWLVTPPEHTKMLAICILVDMIVDRTSTGHMILVNAKGKIAMYQAFLGGAILMTFPLAWFLVELGFGVLSIGAAMIITKMICSFGRVWLARSLVGMSVRLWLSKVFAPLLMISFASILGGIFFKYMFIASLSRIFGTTIIVDFVVLSGAWLFVLDESERAFLSMKLLTIISRQKRVN